jgi:hypothetical protein
MRGAEVARYLHELLGGERIDLWAKDGRSDAQGGESGRFENDTALR